MLLRFLFICIFLSSTTQAQSILDEFSESNDSAITYELVTEKILNISLSKRIFLISNLNDSFSRGDFVTFLIQKKPISRGLVAKINDKASAIKITKIYNLNLFNTLNKSQEIQIIRGDDSYYRLKKADEKKDDFKIEDEEDLYSDTNILEDEYGSIGENKKSIIKNDNVVSVSIANVEARSPNGDTASTQQIQIAWMYQLQNNIWIEGLFGQHIIKDYPSTSIDTAIKNFSVKAKYAFKGPLYTVILPYIGFQIIDADSPGAGVQAPSETQANLEISLVEELKQRQLIFGVTFLKRLVPGWFIKVEVGTDNLAGGLSLEF